MRVVELERVERIMKKVRELNDEILAAKMEGLVVLISSDDESWYEFELPYNHVRARVLKPLG